MVINKPEGDVLYSAGGEYAATFLFMKHNGTEFLRSSRSTIERKM